MRPEVPTRSNDPARRALLVLLLAALALVVLAFSALAGALFLAAVLASVLWPLQLRLSRVLRNRPGFAAGLLVTAVVLVMVGPVVGLSAVVVRQGAEAVRFVGRTAHGPRVDALVARLPDSIERGARQVLDAIPRPGAAAPPAGSDSLTGGIARLAGAARMAVTATGALLFHTAMMVIALYFFLAEKERLLAWLDDASPLRPGQLRELLIELRNVAGAVLRSTVLTALAQSAVAFIGYLIAQVPQPVFFGVATFFFALIPAIGAASVCLLAAALLLATGHTGYAIFLAAWGVLLVGLVDNILKPLLVRGGRGVELHGGVVFFSLIGGIAAFGMLGLLLGPLAVALFIACLRIYRRDFGRASERPQALA